MAMAWMVVSGAALAQAPLAGPTATSAPAAAEPPGCELHWRLAPLRDTWPPRVQLTLSFDAGNRSRTELQLPEGSTLALLAPGAPASTPAAASASAPAPASAPPTASASASASAPASAPAPTSAPTSASPSAPPPASAATPAATAPSAAAVEALAGRPQWRSIGHRPNERVTLRFVLTPGPGAWVHVAPDSLLFAGRALLPLPLERGNERRHVQMCISFEPLTPEPALLANQGQASATDGLLRLQGPVALAHEWVVAAGALQQAQRRAEGQLLRLVAPATVPEPPAAPPRPAAGGPLTAMMAALPPVREPLDLDAAAESFARQVSIVRHHWSDGPAPDAMLLWLPVEATAKPAGLALHGASLLQWPDGWPPAGAAGQALLLRTALQGWFRERFGPVAYEHRPDETAQAWFTDGFSRFYTQRLRALAGQATLEDQAALLVPLPMAVTEPAKAAAPAAAPWAWLPMQWHTALRAAGHPGLDAVLKRLLVPAAQAQPTGPLSSPLAVHRLVAALRPTLGDTPRRDVLRAQAAAAAGTTPVPAEGALGPCFQWSAERRQLAPTSAEPTPACLGWLGIGRDAELLPPAKGKGKGAKPVTGTKAAKGAAGKGSGKARRAKAP